MKRDSTAKPMEGQEQARKLPVTAELGSEGGSYGDATQQVETFAGEFGNPRVDQKQAGLLDAEAATPTLEEPQDPGGMLKHATESPASKDR
jgi:hypothetical protein